MNEGIKKKVAAHNRKEKKLAKKDPTWKSHKKKDPGIPNSFPYKGRILSEIEEAKRLQAEERERRRVEQREAARIGRAADEDELMDGDNDEAPSGGNRLEALMRSVTAAEEEYNEKYVMDMDDDEDVGTEFSTERDSSRKAFDGMAKDVIEASDVILYVLDSRNPLGSRSREVEESVLAHPEKRLIFVLNKIDLVPDDVLRKWKAYLELLFPTIPLAAASSASNAQTFKHPGLSQSTTSSSLLQALKKYAAKADLKRSISVGVIGYPNVGKSSVINSLIARNGLAKVACPVGAQAGVTTSTRKVKVDNKLSIWDSPGVVFPSIDGTGNESSNEKHAKLVLLNALPPKHIGDPIPSVSLLLRRLSKNSELAERLKRTYDLPPMITSPHEKYATEFLVHVARKMGRLGKGGVPDLSSAATVVLTDWRDGRITGWALPPSNTLKASENETSKTISSEQVTIVSEWSQEFNLGELWDQLDGNEMEE